MIPRPNCKANWSKLSRISFMGLTSGNQCCDIQEIARLVKVNWIKSTWTQILKKGLVNSKEEGNPPELFLPKFDLKFCYIHEKKSQTIGFLSRYCMTFQRVSSEAAVLCRSQFMQTLVAAWNECEYESICHYSQLKIFYDDCLLSP